MFIGLVMCSESRLQRSHMIQHGQTLPITPWLRYIFDFEKICYCCVFINLLLLPNFSQPPHSVTVPHMRLSPQFKKLGVTDSSVVARVRSSVQASVLAGTQTRYLTLSATFPLSLKQGWQEYPAHSVM